MEKCAGRDMPQRRDIDPIDLRRALPHVVMMDVLRDPLDFVERITGEIIQHHNTCNYQGVHWRTLPERNEDSQIFKFFQEIVETRQPKFAKIPYVGPHSHIHSVEVFAGPLSNEVGEVYKIIAFVEYLTDN